MYNNEIDNSSNKPKEDNSGNTCTDSCDSLFPKLTRTSFCQSNCNSNEFYLTNSPNECISDCELFIGDYYYEENNSDGHTKKICIVDCKSKNRFYFEGDKKCYDKCEKESKN